MLVILMCWNVFGTPQRDIKHSRVGEKCMRGKEHEMRSGQCVVKHGKNATYRLNFRARMITSVQLHVGLYHAVLGGVTS
jgi:hypothetical protein